MRRLHEREKMEDFFVFVGGGWGERVLSQMCLIWKRRVSTIGPSFVQCRFLQISHLPLTRNSAKTSSTTQRPRARIKPWSRFVFFPFITQCRT